MKREDKEAEVIDMAENKNYADMRMAQNRSNPAERKMFTMCENADHFFCICPLKNHKAFKSCIQTNTENDTEQTIELFWAFVQTTEMKAD